MKSNLYISRKVLNTQDILEWAHEQGFDTMMPEDSLHVTVVFCKKVVDWTKFDRDEPEMLFLDIDEGERSIHNFDGGACVLEFKSDDLIERNTALKKLGIKGNHPEYRSHITITYKKPEGLDVSDIEPYRGYIVLGPEVIEPINNDWKNAIDEIPLDGKHLEEAQISELDRDRVFEIFTDSYMGTTGKAWDRKKFDARAANWTFYGDDNGFVAFREQASGMRKLVAVAGETSGVVKGLKQLVDENKPTWGAVSEKLARASKKFGFIAPHTYMGGGLIIKSIISAVPSSVFGGVTPKVSSDGGITLDYDDVGTTNKYFIGNKPYFARIAKEPLVRAKGGIVARFIAMVGGEKLNEQRLDEVAGSFSMFNPKTKQDVMMTPRGIDHGEYIYLHPEEFGFSKDELRDPETRGGLAHNINAAFTKGWIRVNNYRGAWFFNAPDVKSVRAAAVFYTKLEHYLEEVVADIGPDSSQPLKAFTLTDEKDIDRFIRAGRLPEDITRWLAQ